jgi:type I restriction enzyme S subunit
MKNWVRKKIAEISTVFEDGDWIESKDQSTDGIRLIQTGNVGNGIFKDRGEKARYISETTFKRLRCTEIFEGDCLVSRLPDPVGRACILPDTGEKMITAVDCTIIRFDNKQIIPNWFLYYSLSNEYQNEIQKQVTGATRQRISRKNLGLVSLPVAPLPEQQRIVSILDECFAAIDKAKANAEQNLKNAKELFESYLQGVFENGNENWEVNCLDELGTITSSKRIYKSEYVKDGVPFYRTKEIKELSNGKPITLELFISRQRYEQIKQSFGVPKIGDLLMSAVGTIGEIMVIENEDEFYFKDGNIVWFKDFEKLDTNYLKYALTAFVEKIKSLAIGAAYSALTIEKLNKYQIAFPSTIDEQQTIVRQLDALRAETQKLEAVYQKKIGDLEELKKSILLKAFAGELKTEKALAV